MNETINLDFSNKKQWFKAVLLGFLIGLAVILPGISGATIAIIFGLYSSMIYSLGNIIKQFKKCFLFLLPIGIGLVIGFVVGFFFVREIFEIQPFIIICLFAGLMIGSFPAVKDEIKGVKWDVRRIILFVIGIVIPVVIGIVSILIQVSSTGPIIPTPTLMIAYFLMGFVVSITQIIPGLSCSALLMAFGQFGAILASIHLDYLLANPLVILTIALLVVGFIIGLVVFSKLLNKFIERKKTDTFTVIVGLSLGSIITMFLNPEMSAVYTSLNELGDVLLSLGLGILLLAIGFVISYLIVRYQRTLTAKQSQQEEDNINKKDEK